MCGVGSWKFCNYIVKYSLKLYDKTASNSLQVLSQHNKSGEVLYSSKFLQSVLPGYDLAHLGLAVYWYELITKLRGFLTQFNHVTYEFKYCLQLVFTLNIDISLISIKLVYSIICMNVEINSIIDFLFNWSCRPTQRYILHFILWL